MSHQIQAFETGRAWIEISTDNLRHNILALRTMLPPSCKLMPAVKANAYGHGAVLIAKELSQLGIDAFCVAALQEGIELRENGITGEILILGYTAPEEFEQLYAYALTQTVINYDYAQCLNAHGNPLKVHIKVDTGMHRLGEWYAHTEEIVKIFAFEHLLVDGIYTHLCTADDPCQTAYMNLQIDRFYTLVCALEQHGLSLPKLHIQNSYGVLRCPELRCDFARVGIAMYGALSKETEPSPHGLSLRPVLSLKARVELIQHLKQGEPLGYDLAFTAHKKMTIATIAIGYADGIPRDLSCQAGAVLIHGKRAPIVGRICMDQLTVDATDIPDLMQGDIAVIIGQSQDASISACDIARQTNTISNEVLSRLGARLNRIVLP